MWKVFTVNYPREKYRLRGFITYPRVVQITHWTQENTGKSQIGVLGSQMESCYSSEYVPFFLQSLEADMQSSENMCRDRENVQVK